MFSFFNGAHEATDFAVWSVLIARSVPQVWLFETGSPGDTEASETFVLQPVVPGLNMPLVIPLRTTHHEHIFLTQMSEFMQYYAGFNQDLL